MSKYNQKMEAMILQRYKGNTKNQVKTAKGLLKDFKSLFAAEAVKNITPESIRDKYQSMKKNIPTTSSLYNWPPEPPKSTFKDDMFEAMKKSDNMTITVKGTEITVVFK